MRAVAAALRIRTHGPMSYFPLRRLIEEKIRDAGVKEGLVTIHAKGATPGILVVDRDDLDAVDRVIKSLVPVAGWRHGNAYAHLRSTILSTTHTLVVKDARLYLPPRHEVYFVETRPVYNHERIIHLVIRGR